MGSAVLKICPGLIILGFKINTGNIVDTSSEIRLNKFISDSGFCSRREADKLIEQNRVKINGEIPELGTKVQLGDLVLVDGKRISASARG